MQTQWTDVWTQERSVELIQAVTSDSLFLCPWNFPGKNTEVGYHFLLEGIFLTQRLNLSFFLFPVLAAGFFTTEPPGKPREGESEINWESSSDTIYILPYVK